MLPPEAEVAVDRYLRLADALGLRIEGFYVVGSTALGAYRPDRSDIDFVALLGAGPDAATPSRELSRLRSLHRVAGAWSAWRALRRGQLSLPGTCNGVFVRADDLTRPVTAIVPVASHTGPTFTIGRGFDVNPVVWTVLADHGIAVRGPEPGTLGLNPQPELLRSWNLANLDTYWRPWAEAMLRGPGLRWRVRPRRTTAWGVLGPPRLHHTIATGGILSKEAAGHYALDTFGPEWNPLIARVLSDEGADIEAAGRFVLEVVRVAHDL